MSEVSSLKKESPSLEKESIIKASKEAAEKESVEASESNLSSKKKKGKRQILRGQAHIQCTYNNTMIMLGDAQGGVLAWSSSGLLGFKGAKKSTPYAATQVVADVTEKVRKYQLKELEVFVKGVGSGREAAVRALANNGFELILIKDVTPIAHNGCRPRRPRRV
ncbi:MAG: 30S ribosomal protein S11 [Candidatus Moranbacteria bacterium]|nr:30S ribosomal protein S11 [Candidatus Moranbacteria bacterium]